MKIFSFLTTLLIPGLLSAGETTINLDRLPLLFVDDSGVFSQENLERRFHEATTDASAVLEPETEWEGNRVYIYGSVMRDPEGGFRMWYLGRPQPETVVADNLNRVEGLGMVEGLRNHGFDLVLYATSPDGRKWTRPDQELYSYNSSRANNIVFDLHSPSILLDESDPDPGRRYKMVGAFDGNYYAAVSPDGIHWRNEREEPILEHSDTISLAQDPSTNEYLAFHKRYTNVRGYSRRVVWLSRSRDFESWIEPKLALAPDEIDDAWVTRLPERTEIYNLSVYPHAGGYLGFPTIFRLKKQLDRKDVLPGQSPVDGPIDVQLATSRDGLAWHRPYPRTIMIPRGLPGTFDAGAILGVATAPLNVEDETWLYYTAITTGHGGPLPAKRIAIGRAVWRRDGFGSLNAGPVGGKLETSPLHVEGGVIVVNADASRGELRVAVLEENGTPIEGMAARDCDPLRADDLRWKPSWGEKTKVPSDRPIRVVIEMASTRLFSLSSGNRVD